jgi:hypothetical protein
MKRHWTLALVIAGILAALAIMFAVGVLNGGDAGGDEQPPTLTPSPSQQP